VDPPTAHPTPLSVAEEAGEVSRQQVTSFLPNAWYVSSLLLRMAGRVPPGHMEGKAGIALPGEQVWPVLAGSLPGVMSSTPLRSSRTREAFGSWSSRRVHVRQHKQVLSVTFASCETNEALAGVLMEEEAHHAHRQ
jgi:hypothetical protein